MSANPKGSNEIIKENGWNARHKGGANEGGVDNQNWWERNQSRASTTRHGSSVKNLHNQT